MPRSTPGTAPWFRVLEAARTLSRREGEQFTAAQLAREAQIEDTAKSRGSQIAGAWLSKFLKWGYVDFVGKVDGGGIRQTNAYTVTKTGRTCEVTEGCPAKLVRLIAAVRAVQKVYRTPKGEAAFGALIKLADEMEG